MAFTIRQAILADAADIAKLHFDVWGQTYAGMVPQSALDQLTLERRQQDWRETLSKPGDTWVAVTQNHSVGFVRFAFDGKLGNVQYIYIDPGFQGQGIGRALMQHALTGLFSAGCKTIELAVVDSNTAALDFYKSIGGAERAELRQEGHFWKSLNRTVYWEKPK